MHTYWQMRTKLSDVWIKENPMRFKRNSGGLLSTRYYDLQTSTYRLGIVVTLGAHLYPSDFLTGLTCPPILRELCATCIPCAKHRVHLIQLANPLDSHYLLWYRSIFKVSWSGSALAYPSAWWCGWLLEGMDVEFQTDASLDFWKRFSICVRVLPECHPDFESWQGVQNHVWRANEWKRGSV